MAHREILKMSEITGGSHVSCCAGILFEHFSPFLYFVYSGYDNHSYGSLVLTTIRIVASPAFQAVTNPNGNNNITNLVNALGMQVQHWQSGNDSTRMAMPDYTRTIEFHYLASHRVNKVFLYVPAREKWSFKENIDPCLCANLASRAAHSVTDNVDGFLNRNRR
jgi:hypothetical protein